VPQDVIMHRARKLREEVDTLAEEMSGVAERFHLPPPLPALAQARRRLRENTYTVLVMGEAKRGKSTYINALMGEEILPTDVDIATSQVFHVRHAPEWAFRLRYEDDSAQDITREELAKYGQEQRANDRAADPSAALPLGKILRWIEVEGPFPFLPENVRLLDSPGLGALYREHGRVIRRFVPQAEAVVFVLSSAAPINEFEMESVGEVLRYTRHVFFVQTQIDLHAEEQWRTVWERNYDLLNKRFGKQIGVPEEPIQIWPVSGRQLLNVVHARRQSQVEQFYQDSRFAQMERGLRRFLFQLTGCARIAEVLTLADGFYQEGRKHLAERAESAQIVEQAERDAMARQKRERMEQFIADWGAQGARRRELEAKILQSRADVRAQFITYFDAPTGYLYKRYAELIEGVRTVAEAEDLARTMEKDLPEKGNLYWLHCARAHRIRLTGILAPEFGDPQTWNITAFNPVPTARARIAMERSALEVKDTPAARAKMAWGGAATILGLGGALSTAIALPAILLGGAWVALGYAAWEMHRAGEKLTEQNAKPQLRNYLRFALDTVRAQYLAPQQHGPSLTDAYFRRVEDEIFMRISEMYEQRRVTFAASLRDLEGDNQVSENTLRQKLAVVEVARGSWEQFLPRVSAALQEAQTLYSLPLPDPDSSGEPLTGEELEAAKAHYRELLARVRADDHVTPAEREELDELADRLNLPRRLTRQIEQGA
jgi:GTPase SAR1 family protein